MIYNDNLNANESCSLPTFKTIHRDEFDQSLSSNPFNYEKVTGRNHLENSFQEFAFNLPSTPDGKIISKLLHDRNCPLCNHPGHSVLFTKYRFPICKCSNCGFIFASPSLAHDAIDSPSMNIDTLSKDHLSLLSQDLYIQCAKKRFEYELQKALLFCHKVPETYLEIGCSIGTGIEVASSYNLKCIGFEPNKDTAEIALKRGLKIIPDFFNPKYLQGQRFDLIASMDVLEHIDQPINFLKMIAEVISDDGLLLLQVPNAGGLISLAEWDENQIFNGLIHLNYFDSNSLNQMVQKAGFKCVASFSILSELGKLKKFSNQFLINTLTDNYPELVRNFKLHQDWINDNNLGYKIIGIYSKQ